MPVPETARIAAIALAEELGLPYREVLIKNRYIKRTFILDSQEKRQKAVNLKLSPVRSEIEGKRVILVDDSIVRGTTSRKIIELVRKAGASKVYFVSTCPPIQHPCFYGIDFPVRSGADRLGSYSAGNRKRARRGWRDLSGYRGAQALHPDRVQCAGPGLHAQHGVSGREVSNRYLHLRPGSSRRSANETGPWSLVETGRSREKARSSEKAVSLAIHSLRKAGKIMPNVSGETDPSLTGSTFNPNSYSVLYRGSVKDVRGPIETGRDDDTRCVVFDYTDSYSVFDWGRMPDPIVRKGSALALIAASWFERIEKAETWKEYSRTPEAMALRKGNRFGAVFNEIGEELQRQGIRTHYLGVLPEASRSRRWAPPWISRKHDSGRGRFRTPRSRSATLPSSRSAVVKPTMLSILSRAVPDYGPSRGAPLPRLIPLEVVFRFGVPEGSSLLERAARDPGYMASIGFADFKAAPGEKWEFPVLELFTKLESTDRPLSLSEALAISGLTGAQLQETLLKTAWVAGLLKSICAKAGIELADGKLEWAVSERGGIFLVDAIGPDELRLLKDGVQLSKEFLRIFYRETPWYQKGVVRAKELAQRQGVAEWKKYVGEQPPQLPANYRELASQLYMSLANVLTGRKWFPEAWSLDQVVRWHPESAGAAVNSGAGRQTVLLIGSGGREHAMAWKLAQSPKIGRLIVAPGGDGMTGPWERWADVSLAPAGFDALASRALSAGVALAVIGPDNALADGIVDALEARGIRCFGPTAAAARIESSKAFAKDVMQAAGVPTARSVCVDSARAPS